MTIDTTPLIRNSRVVVLGASSKPERYAYKAVVELAESGFQVFPIGNKVGTISEHPILLDQPKIKNVHTVTIYLRKELQVPLYNYILSFKPKRIIFNPGAENLELNKLANEAGIKTENACTLVMLATKVF